MGAKVSNQKNLLIPEQVEDVIEYEGYEEFQAPVIEVNRKAETKIDKIRPNASLNNHSGGSSIGKYESENCINKSKDKIDNNNNNNQDENAKSKEESKFIKEKTDKKEEENNNINNNNDNKENNENNIILVNNNIEENKEPEKVEEKGDILRGQNNNVNKVEINLEEKKPEENEQNNGGENINNEIKEIKEEIDNNQNINQNYKNFNNGITEIKEEDINYNENDEKLNTDDNNNINNDDNKNDDFVEEKKIENDNLNNNIDIDDKGNENNNEKEINNIEVKNEDQKVLQEGAGNELLFMSYLNEIVHISIKDRVIYSQKFCITSKDNFLIYENKDNYIQVKKPLAIIPISSIKNVVLFKLTKKIASYDHFYIEFDLDENNRNNINDRIDTFYENDINNKTNENLKNTALVLFKTEEKNLAKEWYVLLKFLIDLKLKK